MKNFYITLLALLLLISWAAVGYLWYVNTAAQNEVGSMLKDVDLTTCTQIDTTSQEFKQKMQAALEELSQTQINDADADISTVIQGVILDQFDYEQRLCFTEGALAQESLEMTFAILEEFTETAKEQAQDASFKASVSSTVADVMLCIEQDGYVTEPGPNVRICRDDQSARLWPEFAQQGASWGGCDFMIDRKDQEFTYCATNKGVVNTCTAEGCQF